MRKQSVRGSASAISEIVKMGTRISAKEMAAIATSAQTAGGTLKAVEVDDDWCGNGRIHFPWPPKKNADFLKFCDKLVAQRINFEVLVNGIPVPDEIMVTVSRRLKDTIVNPIEIKGHRN